MGTISTKKRGPHPHNHLTAVSVRSLGPGRWADGGGLYLVVDDSGARRWQLRTLVHGRRREIGLGSVRDIPLKEAREAAQELRRVARAGGDPVAHRDRSKRRSMTFEQAARHVWQEQVVPNGSNPKHVQEWSTTLETYAFPKVGRRPVHAVDQADVLRVLAPIWTEVPETARRVRQRLRTVLAWARTAGHADGVNPVEGVEKGLPRQKDRTRHFKALPYADLPELMARVAEVDGMGAKALRFAVLTAARSGEVRGATWREIDMDAKVWTIPPSRMKAGLEHRVPLSDEALAVLETVRPLANDDDALVFPSTRRGRPLSDMTLAAVLKRLEVPATVHGMRSTFKDWCRERTKYSREVSEAALAHVIRDETERAYARSDLLARRVKLMDDWARYAAGATADRAKVVPLLGATAS